MIYRIRLFAAAAMLLACCSCLRQNESYKCNSYIQGYYAIDDMSASSRTVILSGDAYREIDVYVSESHRLGDFTESEGGFAYYSTLHKDTGHKEYHAIMPVVWYPGDDISSVTVRCTEAWDEDHPAGSSLADIAVFAALSVRPYIDGGYTPCEYGPADRYPLLKCVYPEIGEWKTQPWYPVSKPLQDIKPEEMSLIGETGDVNPLFSLFIPLREDNTSGLEMTVTDVTGKVIDVSVKE